MDNYKLLRKFFDRDENSRDWKMFVLFETRLRRETRLEEWDRRMFDDVGWAFVDNPEICLELYDFYRSDETEFSTVNKYGDKISVTKEAGLYVFTAAETLLMTPEQFFILLEHLSDCFLPVLPLGSVVRLKNRYFSDQMEIKDDTRFDVVITDRFLAYTKAGIYCPYGGVIHPLGAFEQNQKIQFGPQLVQEVIHPGYSDKRENEFVARMKEKMLVKKRLHSIAFSNEEEIEKMRNHLI